MTYSQPNPHRFRRFHTGSVESLGVPISGNGLGWGAVAWGTSNKAIFVPTVFDNSFIIRKIITYSNTGANYDMGIYDSAGNRLISTGSQVGVSDSYREIDVTDLALGPGLYYYALNCDNGAGQMGAWQVGTAAYARGLGAYEMAAAFPLPASATFATMTQTFIPLVGVMAELLI